MKKALSIAIGLFVFPVLTASAAMLRGTVQEIDQSKNQIVLNTADGREVVEIDRATKGADSVKAGDKVKVTYTKKGQKLVASAIAEDKSSPATTPSDRSETPPKAERKSPMGVR